MGGGPGIRRLLTFVVQRLAGGSLSYMPHRSRSRSASPEGERDHSRSARRRDEDLPYDAKSISESDYFLKSDEFRLWLREEKKKVCMQSSAKAESPPAFLQNVLFAR